MKTAPYALLVIVAGIALIAACTTAPQDGTNPSDEAQLVAESWIRLAPTYAHDGTDLQLQDEVAMESYPVQYLLTYTFTSQTAGYGARTGEITAQVLTDHTIVVKVVNNEVTSAVIDGYWDEVNQKPLETSMVQLEFQPVQCVQTPWEEWYANGSIQYFKAPTDEELIRDYYAQVHSIELGPVLKIAPDDVATCDACNVCARNYYYKADVVAEDASVLEQDGWAVVEHAEGEQ